MRTDDLWPSLGASLPDMLMLLDPDGTILFINRPLDGLSADDVVGTNVFDLVPTAYHARASAILEDVFGHSRIGILEFPIMRATGERCWVQASAGPYRDGNRVLATTVLVRDITPAKATEFALQQLERQLQQVQKLDLVGHFASGIVHDFANLLMIIRASIEAMLLTLPTHGPERDAAISVQTAAIRGHELTRQLMAFIRAGEPTGDTVDLNVVVEAAFAMLSRLLGRDIRLQIRLHPGLVYVLAERGQLEQVLSNLVLNASDALPPGGTITIATRVEPSRDEVLLSVIDSGAGMDDVTQRRIFEPFFTTKVSGRGTGLGLSTVALIAERLGGRVVVKSALGVGTTIDVILPLMRPKNSP